MGVVSAARRALPERALAKLAGTDATGVLVIAGDPEGAIRISAGTVTGVLVRGGDPWPGLPSEPGSAAAEVDAVLEIADRAFVLLGGRIRECRFRPEDPARAAGHDALPGVSVHRLLAELRRRSAALDDVGLDPRADRLGRRLRASDPAERPVPVTRAEQALLDVADGDVTCVEAAARCGRGVYTTTLDASRLVRLGLLEVAGSRPELLHRRRPGASRIRPREPAPPMFDHTDAEAVDRFLAAMDSLRASGRYDGSVIPPAG